MFADQAADHNSEITRLARNGRKSASCFRRCAYRAVSASAFAASEHLVEGRLECDLSRSEGTLFGSQQDGDCFFCLPGVAFDTLRGTYRQFRLEIGELEKARMVWAVTAVSKRQSFDLEGTYSGFGAAAAVGVGVTILTGGPTARSTFGRSPSTDAMGLDVSFGITQLHLKPAILLGHIYPQGRHETYVGFILIRRTVTRTAFYKNRKTREPIVSGIVL
ncbi:hypothetical protein ASG19_13870 [Rhizobium sp. Leaf306]|uniref:DUF992 domain-containing protein n=1 Tax=Rhizobium sp. Leaf306 TaxID=1736330 RepID=UPI000712EC93|nr:DUF992 domain-containing protein [Rhizobium sp. Leaf306]KQQ34850.1 hypothetical protein ASG19_13870 [Rhizobium sp. Leaf306]